MPDHRPIAVRLLLALLATVLLAFAVLGYFRWRPVAVADGWHYSVVADGLAMIDSLGTTAQGDLLGTLDFNHGKGKLVHFGPDWKMTVLLDGLSKPAGLLPFRDGVLVAQEEQDMSVMYWSPAGAKPFFKLEFAEGITQLPSGNIAIIADRKDGTLVEVNPVTGKNIVLLNNLDKGEGLCAMPDGRLYFTEKQRDSALYLYQPGIAGKPGSRVAVTPAVLQAPGFLLCTPQGIWITEDRTNDGRLLFWDFSQLHTIADHLHAPQYVLAHGDNEWLLAEQGRARLLRITRDTH